MIVLMGIAGAGKGTQAQMLVEKNGYSLISTGDLLRTHATEEQQQRMLNGVLLRDEEIFELIGKALDEVPDLQKCILDGTPRSIPQVDWLLGEISKGRFEITAVIHINVDERVVRGRLMARGRSDDTENGISKRFEEYRSNTLPILNYLREKGIHVYQVEGDRSPGEVHDEILQILGQHP